MKIGDDKGKNNNEKVLIVIPFYFVFLNLMFVSHHCHSSLKVKSFMNILYSLQSCYTS